MRTIEFDTTKSMILDLKPLQAGSLTIKEIETDSFESLNQIFQVKTIYPNQESQFIIVLSGYVSAMHRSPKIELDYKIEDSDNTIIEAKHDLKAKYMIYYETLTDKIKRIKAKKSENQLNIKSEVDKWKQSIEELYSEIEEWKEPVQDDISLKKIDLLITEELTGSYPIKALTITLFNGQTINFEPRGTFIIGSKGRIDVNISGRYQDSIMLILQRNEGEDKWSIIRNRDLKNAKEFNKGQFLSLIDNVIEK